MQPNRRTTYMKKSKRKKNTRNSRLGRGAWIGAARQALIRGGIEAVKVDRLASALAARRSGFYYHFRDRGELLRALLHDWKVSNMRSFDATMKSTTDDGVEEFKAIVDMWLEESEFDPAYDASVRDWARISPEVARAVKRVDARRIGVLNRIFRDLGYSDPEAFIRARITYFHQVGYYTLELRESRKRRRELAPTYMKVLLGF